MAKFKLLLKQFLIIVLYFIIVIAIQLIFISDLDSTNLVLLNSCYIAIDLITLIIFIFLFRKTLIPDYYDFIKDYKKYIKNNYKYWLIGLVIMVISNLIIGSFIGLPDNEEANRSILLELPVYSVISMVIIAPIIEELLTRLVLKDAFKHSIFYMLITGLIFGSLHITSVLINNNLLELLYIIPYGALGCALSKIYHNSNNIWTNIFFHALHNFIAILLIFTGV